MNELECIKSLAILNKVDDFKIKSEHSSDNDGKWVLSVLTEIKYPFLHIAQRALSSRTFTVIRKLRRDTVNRNVATLLVASIIKHNNPGLPSKRKTKRSFAGGSPNEYEILSVELIAFFNWPSIIRSYSCIKHCVECVN